MSLKSKFSSVVTFAFAVAAFATFTIAQDATKTQDDNGLRKEGRQHRGERGTRGGEMFGLRGIELTDAQKEQIRQIHEANKPSEAVAAELKSIREARKNGTEITEAQRDRLKAFREEMKSKQESVHSQILAVLTAEQRQQLETRKAEMEKRREE